MWTKKYTYHIIDNKTEYHFGNDSWVEDWYDFSRAKAEDIGLNEVVSESFAINITNLMGFQNINPDPNSYLKEITIRKVIEGLAEECENNYMMEWEQKKMAFGKILKFYTNYITEYEKRIVSVMAHVPDKIYQHIRKGSIVEYVVEQSEKYVKDRTIKKEPYGNEFKIRKFKEKTLHFTLSPTEYDKFKNVDGNTNSNRMLNLYLHEMERNRQKKRRIEILNQFFPNKSY